MLVIAHRANLNGPDPASENTPSAITRALSLGFDVEIDIWHIDGGYRLGHDKPQYEVELSWLSGFRDNLWIHCKNIDALYQLSLHNEFNYFWHQSDDFTLTSKGYIWTYPGKPSSGKSIIVLPELNLYESYKCFGICTDYPHTLGVCTDYSDRIM
jgi:hypothetical protein